MSKTSTGKAADIAVSGILTALVLLATMFINIRLPISINGGLIHLGNVPLFIAAIVFDKKKGAVAGAFGMGLFDVLSGWTLWAPFTFVIRGVMGYIIGTVAEKKQGKGFVFNLAAIAVGGLWMIFGYYIAEAIIYGNLYVPLTSVPGNLLQITASSVLALPLLGKLRQYRERIM